MFRRSRRFILFLFNISIFILQGSDIIVGTVARVADLVENGILDVSNIRFVIIDEADEVYLPS